MLKRMIITRWMLATSILICVAASWRTASAATLYVSKAGNDANDGQSWATAKLTVQAGLDAALSGDQVWVAAGTYFEQVTLRLGIALYGGFAGSETDLAQRDWVTYLTILDGLNSTLQSGVVTSPIGATATTRIDGFTIRNAQAFGGGTGISCFNSSPTIFNNTITGNTSRGDGGGIACLLSSSPTISNNTITSNNNSGNGSGIYCASSSAPTITYNKIFGNNTYNRGGGIYCLSSSPSISNNLIIANIAGSNGAGIFCDSSSSPPIFNNVIAGNSATLNAGGGITCVSTSFSTITNNTIVANTAASGGGIVCTSSLTISNNIVAFNSSGLRSTAAPTLQNNCVYNPAGADYTGLSPGVGDISVDPQLVAVDYGELHLKPGSPCIDAGLDSMVQPGWVDTDGESRIQGAHVDIGADEFIGVALPFTPRILRVSPSGDDANDGTTWALAKQTVQAGIDAAAAAGGGEVWVAAGTYNQRITLKQWTHVYGGFAGAESSRDQRNWVSLVTILDGGAGKNVVTASMPGYGWTTIDGFTIRNGNASNGGGIYCSNSSPKISNNTITANSTSNGGGIYCLHSFARISSNTITANIATTTLGGGILCLSSGPAISGNVIKGNSALGIDCASSSPAITDNTIIGNTHGGIYLSSSLTPVSSPLISNNIVVFNSAGLYSSGGTPTLRNNCVYNPAGANYTGLIAGTGDISVDPLFVNMPTGDYHLSAGSPCIDAGYNAVVPAGILTDLAGHPRFLDDPITPDCQWAPGNCGSAPIVDMGAYEFVPVFPGDFDRNGYVNSTDLVIFAACATRPGIPYDPNQLPQPLPGCTLTPDAGGHIAADFNADGIVDMDDFGIQQRCYSGNQPANLNCAN